jgi:hypothetical protein
MGLRTSQSQLRDKMLASNIYSPKSLYDLTKDDVTKTLNKLSSFGLDIRTTLLGSTVEKIANDSPLTRKSFEYYAEAMKMRSADNIAHNFLPQVDFNNIFDKNKPVVQMHKDWSITKGSDAGIVKLFKTTLGVYDRQSIQNEYHDEGNAYTIYTDKTGNAQKQEMLKQMVGNNFNRYENKTSLNKAGADGRYKLTQDVYSDFYFSHTTSGSVYTSYVKDDFNNSQISRISKVAGELSDTISDFDYNSKMESEGFGSNFNVVTGQSLTDHNTFLTYINASADGKQVVYDDKIEKSKINPTDVLKNFGVKRGLLHYTQQIVNSGSKAGENIAHNAMKYGTREDGTIFYKGSSACRSYTNFNQYKSANHLIRRDGNGNDSSVLKDSVLPKIYPTTNDTSNLMFSLENLAWTKEDFKTYRVPLQQHGANGGRVMWFPPYGLTFSDNTSVNNETINLLGRIEPIHSYNGTTRTIALSFMLLIDTPPHVKNLSKSELANWFANCNPVSPKPQQPVKKEKVEASLPAIEASIEQPATPEPYVCKDPLYYYFDNNSFLVDTTLDFMTPVNYEYYKSPRVGGLAVGEPTDWKNDAGINMAFTNELKDVLNLMKYHLESGYKLRLEIEAGCSALWENVYNARLSFKRADALMKHIVDAYNYTYQGEDRAHLEVLGNFDYDKLIDVSYATTRHALIYNTNNALVSFSLKGIGEEKTKLGQRETEKNKPDVKLTRFAKVATYKANYVGTQSPFGQNGVTTSFQGSILPMATVTASKQQEEEDIDYPVGTTSFKNDMEGIGASGWNKMDYYKPTFHSQTPYDFNERIQFLLQTTRPRESFGGVMDGGTNSLFGKMPVCVLRIGDFIHSKVVVNNVNIDYTDTTWDMNPEGMGMQPMVAKVTMDVSVIGGMGMEWPVNKVLTANDFNFVANGNFYDKAGYYSKDRMDYIWAVRPYDGPEKDDEGKPLAGTPYDKRWERKNKISTSGSTGTKLV